MKSGEGQPFTTPPFPSLLPATSQDGLHLLGLLIDRSVPREPGLLAERCHRLDQLIDLRAEQGLSIAGLDGFRLIGRAAVPVLNGHLV